MQFKYAKLLFYKTSFDEASRFFRRGLKLLEQKEDKLEEPLQYLWGLHYYGQTLSQLGQKKDAEETFRKALMYIQMITEFWKQVPKYTVKVDMERFIRNAMKMEWKRFLASSMIHPFIALAKNRISLEPQILMIKLLFESNLRSFSKSSQQEVTDFLVKKELRAIERLLEWGRGDEALEKYDLLVSSHPDDAVLWENFISFVKDNHDRITLLYIINALERSIDISPLRLDTLLLLAYCYRMNSDLKGEAMIFQKILEIDESPTYLYRYGQLLKLLGQPNTGVLYMKRALDIDPDLASE